jgi:hypothetical protein
MDSKADETDTHGRQENKTPPSTIVDEGVRRIVLPPLFAQRRCVSPEPPPVQGDCRHWPPPKTAAL